MRSLVMVQSILFLLIVGLMGCGTNTLDTENTGGEPQQTNKSKQVEDFEVTIYVEDVENDLDVYATITYTGQEAEKTIYHGGSIFFFNIYQQDGDYEHLGAMNQPLLTTTLIQNEPHKVTFEVLEQLDIKPGTFEFEAIANFSLDPDEVRQSELEIPVSIIKKIE